MVINNITTVYNKTIATTRVKGDIRREGSAMAKTILIKQARSITFIGFLPFLNTESWS